MPGDTITVHAGTYRERIDPPRGGESESKRITYRVFGNDRVFIKGSEAIKNWVLVEKDIWKTTIPQSFFGNFNPFNDLLRGDWYKDKGRQTRTGAVYINGDWLLEARTIEEVLTKKESCFLMVRKCHKRQYNNLGAIWRQRS